MSNTATGKHGHRDSEEPWPHHESKEGTQQTGAHHQASGEQHATGGSEDDQSLKDREYRDNKGEVHHHTKTYMDEHNEKE